MTDRRPLVMVSGEVVGLPSGDKLPISALTSGTPDGTKLIRDDGSLAIPSAAAQTDAHLLGQVIASSVPAKVTGVSTFIQNGGLFDNGGSNNLTIRYIDAATRFVAFEWSVVAREDPEGAGADGTVIINLAVNGVVVVASRCTLPVDASHGGTAAGRLIRLTTLNDVMEIFASRKTGGGNGAIEDVVFSAIALT